MIRNWIHKTDYLSTLFRPSSILPTSLWVMVGYLFPNEMLVRALLSWSCLAFVDLVTKVWSLSKRHEVKSKFKLKKHGLFNHHIMTPVWILVNVVCFTIWILVRPMRKYYKAALVGEINSEHLGRKTHRKFVELGIVTIIIRSFMFLFPEIIINGMIYLVYGAANWRECQSIFENVRDAGLDIEWAKVGIKKKLSAFIENEEE